jgi:hypothetical protein
MKTKHHNLLATGYVVADAWQTIMARGATPAMQAAGEALARILHDIETHALQQAEPLTGKARDRNAVFVRAAEAAHAVARLILGHALHRGLDDLVVRVDLALSAYRRGRMTHRVQLMRQVQAAAVDATSQGVVLGVTPEMLADLDGKIAAADAVLTLPRTNIANRCVATENLRRSVQALKHLLQYTLDPLMDLRRETDLDGYALYKAARIVIDYSRERTAPAPSANDHSAVICHAPEPLAVAAVLPSSDSDSAAASGVKREGDRVAEAGVVPPECEVRVEREAVGEFQSPPPERRAHFARETPSDLLPQTDHLLAGSVIKNSVPAPGALSTRTSPLWACTTFFTMARPRPVPPCSRERALSTR